MLYLIGLGLNVDGISSYGLKVVKRCKRVYLENYTVDFPYTIGQLSEMIGKKIIPANRKKVEELSLVDEANRLDIALLVYGSPLTATTHITLLQEAKRLGVKTKVIHSASVLDAIAETGLQLYKFGKVASMPAWKKNFTPNSFMETIKDNQKINAHSLILIDIGLEFSDALKQLKEAAKEHKIKLNEIILCQSLGNKYQKIFYRKIKDFEEFTSVRKPYCIIIPSKLHFMEKEVLEDFK
jgi:diphthine synthase